MFSSPLSYQARIPARQSIGLAPGGTSLNMVDLIHLIAPIQTLSIMITAIVAIIILITNAIPAK